MTAATALSRLLDGTHLRAVAVGPSAYRIEQANLAPRRTNAPAPPPLVIGDPIEVTARKQPELLGALPLSIFVGQPAEIGLRGEVAGTSAIAALDERMTLAGAGPGRNRLFLRGIADSPFNGPTQATVGVMFDESRLTYSAPDPDVRLVDVARVEVIDGPQGFLHGAGAIGGLYRIIPNQPDPRQVSASLSAGVSSVTDGGHGYLGNAMVNLPLSGSSAVRLVSYGERMPGWIDTGERRDSNSGSLFGVRLALKASLSPEWDIKLSGLHQRLAIDDTQYVSGEGDRSRSAQRPEPHDNDLDHLAVRLQGKLGSARLVAISAKTWHEASEAFDASPNAERALDNRQYSTWDNEVRADGQSGNVKWLAGLSYVFARQDL